MATTLKSGKTTIRKKIEEDLEKLTPEAKKKAKSQLQEWDIKRAEKSFGPFISTSRY